MNESEENAPRAEKAAAPRAARTAKEKEPASSFEEAVERLEKLVERMESGTESLDAMVASFEEGRRLVDYCNRKPSAVERRIELLARQPDGSVRAEPFPEEA